MDSQPGTHRSFTFKQGAFALLLLVGLYYPTSTNGEEHSIPALLVSFGTLISLLAYLAWKDGVHTEIAIFISVPIIILLVGFTILNFVRGAVDFDIGVFVKYCALALTLALNIRTFRAGPLVNAAFFMANCINVVCGIGIIIGIESVTSFITRYYWISDSNLVPLMMTLHKPVLTFGTHSLAGLFIYFFFWVNWENYKRRKNAFSLLFALCYFVFLLALTSFTSLGFAALAAIQMGTWTWTTSRKTVIAIAVCLIIAAWSLPNTVVDELSVLRDLPQIVDASFLNTENSGPLSRYGPGGSLRAATTYLVDHPLSPIGLVRSTSAHDVDSPTHFFVGDSGPIEYLVRGSAFLLILIYWGLYRFLRRNLAQRNYGTTLFLVILAFETGYSALASPRTYFLLPFLVMYLNQIAMSPGSQRVHRLLPVRNLPPSSLGAIS